MTTPLDRITWKAKFALYITQTEGYTDADRIVGLLKVKLPAIELSISVFPDIDRNIVGYGVGRANETFEFDLYAFKVSDVNWPARLREFYKTGTLFTGIIVNTDDGSDETLGFPYKNVICNDCIITGLTTEGSFDAASLQNAPKMTIRVQIGDSDMTGI